MKTTASEKLTDNGIVYASIPLLHDDAVDASPPKPNHAIIVDPVASKFESCSSCGLLAFIVGVALACFAWVANQGWVLVSLLLLGQMNTWTVASAWKHIVVCLLGSACTSIAFWAVFGMIFPTVFGDDDEDDDDDLENPRGVSHKRDISNALQDLGELGFVVGYYSSQNFLTTLVYKPFVELGVVEFENSNIALNGTTLGFMMLWMLCTKLRDYNRTMKRVYIAKRGGSLNYYVAQIV